MERSAVLRVSMGLLVAISGGIHLRLYRQGYRDISLDRVLVIDLSRSFALAVLAALLVSVALVASATSQRPGTVALWAGLTYSTGAVLAYALSRTIGLLGFEESSWITEATWAQVVQVSAIVVGLVALLGTTRASEGSTTPA